MELITQEEGGVLLVQPGDNRIDAGVAAGFKTEMAKLLESGSLKIALDLSKVDFIDSSGLGAIVSVRKRVGNSGEIALFGMRESVQTMFNLTRMDKVFNLYADSGEAVAAMSN